MLNFPKLRRKFDPKRFRAVINHKHPKMVELLSIPIFSIEIFQCVDWFSEHLNRSTVSPVNVQYTENTKDGLRGYDCCAKSKSEY